MINFPNGSLFVSMNAMRRAGKHGRLFGFHIDDWHYAPAHVSLDRGMMGDGVG